MHRFFLRFLALLALALMPAGMVASPAAGHVTPAAEAGHCEGHGKQSEDPAASQAHCATCGALPAFETPGPEAGLIPQAPRSLASMDPILDLEPETATPPPKPS